MGKGRGARRDGAVPKDAFASLRPLLYMGGMAIFPRPVSPRTAFADLRGFFRQDHPYKWFVALCSVLATGLIVYAFVLDARTNILPKEPQIIYFKNWRADRSDVEVLEQLKKDVVIRERALQRKQNEFQGVADAFGIEWRRDAEVNEKLRAAENARVLRAIDARIAKAKAQEVAQDSAAGTGTARPVTGDSK